MKKIILCISLFMVFSQASCALEQTMRGVWVSSVYNLDYPSEPALYKSQLEAEADTIISDCQSYGLTDIFLQVRPACDALYHSDIFPSSAYVCSSQGDNFPDDFDILEYFIKIGKENDINIHAWINPYRITKGNFDSKESALSSLSADSPALALKDDVIYHTDGNLYFDPSSPDVQKLIIDGVSEIVSNYDVAGIHLDDYFYPSSDLADGLSYEKRKAENEEIGDFRRRQVDNLIYSLYDTVKAIRPDCQFGVSPFGVWANVQSNPDGSKTSASQSYYNHYADTLKWVKEGKLDYIMPQLYWNIGSAEADYSKLLSWWDNAVNGTGVKLYTGLAAYRIPENQLNYSADEINDQLSLNLQSENCSGFCVFRHSSIASSEGLALVLTSFVPDANGLFIALEHDDFQTDLPRFHFYGKSDKDLSINGEATELSPNGYFSVSKPLVYGQNVFSFSSGGAVRKIKIFRNFNLNIDMDSEPLVYNGNTCAVTAPYYSGIWGGSLISYFDTANTVSEYHSDSCFTVQITKDNTSVYPNASANEGAVSLLDKNIKWTADKKCGNFYHLEDLGWIKKENCRVLHKDIKPSGKITSAEYTDDASGYTASFKYTGSVYPAITETEDGYALHINGAYDIKDNDFMTDTGRITFSEHGLVYTFTVPFINDISGYKINLSNGNFTLTFYKKPVLSDALRPLENISFLIDAGHGGDASGALSCDPNTVEKDINLEYAQLLASKLESLGANVSYTRTDDTDVSLDERYLLADASNAVFVSLHSDCIPNASMDTGISGISFHVNSRPSRLLAESLQKSISENYTVNYISEHSALYMAKPKNTYSILIENQFVCSPESLSPLMSEEYKGGFTDALADAFCQFFAQ